MPLLLAAATVSEVRSVGAAGGPLDKPGIAIPSRFSQDLQSTPRRLLAALQNQADAFVYGHWLNSRTQMYFRGDTERLQRFLADLSEIEGVQVSLSFSKEEGPQNATCNSNPPADLTCQWSASHIIYGDDASHIHVTIYLGDGKIDLAGLTVPVIVGRAAKTAELKLETATEAPPETTVPQAEVK